MPERLVEQTFAYRAVLEIFCRLSIVAFLALVQQNKYLVLQFPYAYEPFFAPSSTNTISSRITRIDETRISPGSINYGNPDREVVQDAP